MEFGSMTRTIFDVQGNAHYLELGTDFLLLDGRPCIFLEITHECIQLAHTNAPQPITLSTGVFWRDVAGGDPTAEDAGELYAYRLAHWAALRASTTTLTQLQSTIAHLLETTSCSSISLPEPRLDPITAKILEAFDGSEETTRALAHILRRPPEVICQWAARLGKVVAGELALPVQSDESETSHDTEPLITEGETKTRADSSMWFRWTEERERQLQEAITMHAGSLDQVNTPMIKLIASQLGWPWKSVEYKVSRWRKRQRSHEGLQEEAPAANKEDDRSNNLDHQLRHAS
jgi:hypothetical protein